MHSAEIGTKKVEAIEKKKKLYECSFHREWVLTPGTPYSVQKTHKKIPMPKSSRLLRDPHHVTHLPFPLFCITDEPSGIVDQNLPKCPPLSSTVRVPVDSKSLLVGRHLPFEETQLV